MKIRPIAFTLFLGTAAGLVAAAAVPVPLAAPMPKPADSAAGSAAIAVQPSKQQLDFFEGKIRPLLISNCYKCHSATESKAKGGLVLDTREGWQKGGEHGTAVVPGEAEKSLLIKAIGYQDADLQMPPNGKKLTDAEVADLTAWVKMGAPDPRTNGGIKLTGLTDKARSHWAYQPVQNVPVPAVKNAGWVKTPVDAFILAKQEANNFVPSHPAARETLIRRATYDLIGLPTTPEEVQAFVKDGSANAFEKVVDRLLASPRYGERWGRFWLDSARYSDTSGIENNNAKQDYRYPHAWTYRDYVIRSYNQDKPFDQFLKEQIAADLLPDASKNPDNLAALGFITIGKRFQNPNDQIDERIDALGKATMAMTIACARCHDHKFDPIPTADYYSLHGVFNSLVEPSEKPMIGKLPSGPEFADFTRQLNEMEARNREQYFSLIESKAIEFRGKASGYLQAAFLGKKGGVKEELLRNKLVAEYKLDRDLYQGLRLIAKKDDAVFLPFIEFARLTEDQFATKAKGILDQIAASGTSRSKVNPYVVAAFKDVRPEQIKTLRDVTDIYGKLFVSLTDKQNAYFKANRLATTDKLEGFGDSDLVELFNVPLKVHPAGELNNEGLKEAILDLRLQNGGLQRFNFAGVNELMLTHPGAPARAMVVNDSPRVKNSPIFIRGEAQNRGPIVPRQFPEIVSGKDRKSFSNGSGRLELAEAVASKSNPLTARVAMNRLWAHHFGEGFVRTLDDMGTMSEPPSHPELIDYLATRFMNEGWSIKKMHKLVMLSATYQQSSDTNVGYAQKDPDNRFLWRANLRRLDFEAVRDTLLMFTGKLDASLGGKPVNLTDEPYSNRRSVYGYIDRGSVPELMQQFDFPDADMANSKRTTTIVPQQALFFMNSPMSVDVARKATSRSEFMSAKDDIGRVKALYEMLFQRAPKAAEVALARDFISLAQQNTPEVASARAVKGAKPRIVENKIKGGNQRASIRNSGEMVERRPLNAWEQYAQALLMANEIAYVN